MHQSLSPRGLPFDLPDHVPPARLVDFDIYAPHAPGEDYFAAWLRFREQTPHAVVWTPRNGGHSKKSPQLIEINRVMRLQTQAENGSMVAVTFGPGGIPQVHGDGSAKAVVTGDVVDNVNERIGDLYEIAIKAIEVWERLLVGFGLIGLKSGK